MPDSKLHPLDLPANATLSSQQVPPALGVNVSFHETAKNGDRVGSLDSTSTQTRQLRNRLDSKPTLSTTTSNLTSSIAANTSSISNTASPAAGAESLNDPSKTLTRRSTGPGGRLLTDEHEQTPRWTTRVATSLRDLYNKYSPSLVLENKGSIARDHLANERTYLAWLRSSLSLITVGVAVTQLFRLQSSTSTSNELIHVSDMGRPLGGSFIALGILFLWLGTSRYFHSQTVLSYGQFPASRGSVIIATITIMALLLSCFVIVILQGRNS